MLNCASSRPSETLIAMLSGRSTPKPAHASQDDCTLEFKFAGCRGACARGLGARAALGLGTAADVSKTGACAGTALAGPSAGLKASGAIAAARDGGAAEDVGCGGVAGAEAEAAATGARAELMPKWVMRDRGEAEGASTGCAAGAAEAAAAGESAGANGVADTGEVTGAAWAA